MKKSNYLELDAWLCHGSERVRLPVDLLHLLPHDHVEAGAVLVAKDKSCVIVVCYRIHMKRPFKIHSAECRVTCQGKLLKREFKSSSS